MKRPMDGVMRSLRIIHLVFVASAVMSITAGEILRLEGSPDMQIMVAAFAFVALSDLGIGFFLRRSILEAARETLRREPENPEAMQSWRRGHFLSFAFAQSVVLFGLVVRLLVGRPEFAVPFYALGGAALVLWAPRRPDA